MRAGSCEAWEAVSDPVMIRRGTRLRCVLLAGTTAVALYGAAAFADPTGGNVAAGVATINTANGATTINQSSNRAIINWNSFSIGANETTRFIQPGADAAILNRVTGGDISTIQGQLQANGKVYLLNPNGILIGPNGRVDTAAFVASTLKVADSAFMGQDPIRFTGEATASVVNLGVIRARSGDVALIAARVSNQGTISAPNGAAALAAGRDVLYAPDGGDILIQAPASVQSQGATIDNTGTIEAAAVALKAAGGAYAMAINLGGKVSATAVRSVGGTVMLDGGDGDTVVSGAVSAQDGETGGRVQVAGGRVAVSGAIDASGAAGGGVVMIGGGAHGADPAIHNATQTIVTATAQITADATASGNGGSVTIWSDGATRFDGAISAKGGQDGGQGGQAEVSGKRSLGFTGATNLTAPKGKTGTLLLDPDAITVVTGVAPAPANAQDGFWETTEDTGSQTISAGAIEGLLATSALRLAATSTLTVNAAISSLSNNALELYAPTTAINASISLPNGSLFLYGGAPGSGFETVIGPSLTSSPGATLSANSFSIVDYDRVSLAGRVTAVGSNATIFVNNEGLSATSFALTNANNSLSRLIFFAGQPPVYSGDVDIANGSNAMVLAGAVSAGGHISVVSRGDLQMASDGSDTTELSTSGGQITLASTAGAFRNLAGAALFSGAGRRVIYTATDDASFDDGGLGYAHANNVAYPSDPQTGQSRVIYVRTPSGLTLMTITADSFTRLYGQADPTFTANYSDGSAADLTSPVQFLIQGGDDSNVGSYVIVPFGATSATRMLRYVNGTLTVNPAPLTIMADDASRLYGAANPNLTFHVKGLVNGDSASVVSGVALATTATTTSNAGGYLITPSGGSAANYVLSYSSGTLTVAPAPVTVTVNDASRTYGYADPLFSYSASGLVLGQTASDLQKTSPFVLSTTATVGSSVGRYAITASGGGNSNYAITFQPGALTVLPAPLVVSATGRKVYGDTLAYSPAFLQVTGLVNGDPASIVSDLILSSPGAAATAGAGTYALNVSGATLLSQNYTIVGYAGGTLTVTPAPLVIVADDKTWNLPSTPPTLGYTVYGLKNGDPSSLVTGVAVSSTGLAGTLVHSVVGGDTRVILPGDYAIQAAGGAVSSGNYVLYGYQNGVLHIANGLPNLNTTNQIARDVTFTPSPTVTVQQDRISLPLIEAKVVYGPGLGGFGPVAGTVIDMFLASMTNSNPPVTRAQVIAALNDPKTSTAMMGLLVPFLMTELDNILNTSLSSWTDAQTIFVKQMIAYVQAQRQAAAQKAQADYEAWAKAQVAAEERKINALTGPAKIYEIAILSGDPPVPPADFLKEVQAGMVVNLNQTAQMAGMNAQMGALGDFLKIDQGVSTTMELSGVGFQLSKVNKEGTAYNLLESLSPKIAKTLLPFAKERMKNLTSKATDLSKAGEVDKTIEITGDLSETGPVDKTIETAGDLSKTGKIDKAVDAVDDALKTVKELGQALGRVASTAGVVAEVVGNLVQIGVSTALYSQAASYNTQFQKAVEAANKPVTLQDLKVMMSSDSGQFQVAGYMEAALVTGAPDPISNPLTTARPTMSLADILSITSKF